MVYKLFTEPHHFLFRKSYENHYFYIRMAEPSDVPLIYDWVNKPYSRFWGLNGKSITDITALLRRQKEENITCSFFVYQDDSPVALFEAYQVISSEMALKYEALPDDYGIHLLMAPPESLLEINRMVGKFSEKVLRTILSMMFSYSSVNRVIAEPDQENIKAHRLAERVGFHYQHNVSLVEKKARFYIITKTQFLSADDR